MGKLRNIANVLRYITCIILLFVAQKNCLAQNSRDSFGRKQGYWDSCEKGLCYEGYFLNDTLDGPFKSYYQNKTLAVFGLYKRGRAIGIWYYFDESGRLLMEISRIGINSVKEGDYKGVNTNKFRGYFRIYDLNGHCMEEGDAVYDDPEIDIIKIGSWKYYKEERPVRR